MQPTAHTHSRPFPTTLVRSDSPLFKYPRNLPICPIHSLGLVELETLKTYIENTCSPELGPSHPLDRPSLIVNSRVQRGMSKIPKFPHGEIPRRFELGWEEACNYHDTS